MTACYQIEIVDRKELISVLRQNRTLDGLVVPGYMIHTDYVFVNEEIVNSILVVLRTEEALTQEDACKAVDERFEYMMLSYLVQL